MDLDNCEFSKSLLLSLAERVSCGLFFFSFFFFCGVDLDNYAFSHCCYHSLR